MNCNSPCLQRRQNPCAVGTLLIIGICLVPGTPALAEVLTFDQPQTAGISGLRPQWDTPVVLAENGAVQDVDSGQFGKAPSAFWFPNAKARQLPDGKLAPGGLAFDAVHRSLLVRFPGSAAAIAARLRQGATIQKVELVLPFKDTELWPEGYHKPAGMSFLGAQWKDWKPRWHAVAYALRRPWQADPETGPTFNAYMNGAGYWARFGASDTQKDRFATEFGPAEVSAANPEGAVDVTPMLVNPEFGATPADRLRRLDACGLLVRKWETYDASQWKGGYEWQTATGPRGILVKTPLLRVTLADGGPRQQIPAAALQVDMPALRAALLKNKSGGAPTAVLPTAEQIKSFSEKLSLRRPAEMPGWQWQRVQELAALGGGDKFPDTPESYAAWIDDQLALAPRAWRGFDAAERVDNYFKQLEAIPEPVRDHWKLYWWAWLAPDRPYPSFQFNGKKHSFAHGYVGGEQAQAYYKETNDWRGNFSVYRTYCYSMGTMNFNNWNAIGTLGGGRILNSPVLIKDGSNGVENYSFRLWSWFDGSTQESIDHYYFGESLTSQKVIQNIAPGPFEKMMGQSILAKSVEELSSSWHPDLRRFVSSSGRTGIAYVLGIQEGLTHVMHTLSPSGALTDTTAPGGKVTTANVENMPILGGNFRPGRVAQQTIDSPWAPAWVANMVEKKPIPYVATNSYKQWGRFSGTPLWKRSYLGHNYGLATLDVAANETVPFLAQWKRADGPVQSMTQLGTLLARPGVNRTEFLDSIYHDIKQRNPNGSVGVQGQLQFAVQDKNRALFLASPTPQLRFDGGRPTPEKITSLQTSLALMNFEENPGWELYADGKKITSFPYKGTYSQKFVLHDGDTYVGLIPLPGTDLGRDTEVEFVQDGVMTEMQGGGRMKEALRINLYNLRQDTPLDKAKVDWKQIDGAYNGFMLEIGDKVDSGTLAQFMAKVAAVKLDVKPADKGMVDIQYASGADTMNVTFNPYYNGGGNTREAFPVRQVNGAWPYNPAGLERDTSLTQQGTTGQLEKNGAILTGERGRMAYLQTEPISGTYAGYNAFSDPSFWSLKTPGGHSVQADGRLGMAQVTMQPAAGKVWVQYALREEQKTRPDMASALLLQGFKTRPQVWLNDIPVTPVAIATPQGGAAKGTSWAIPLGDGPAFSATTFPSRFQKAEGARATLAGQSGIQLAQNWRILGPFPLNADASNLDTPLPAEKDALTTKPEWSRAYTVIGDKQAAWKEVRGTDKDTGPTPIDLRRLLSPNDRGIALAAGTIMSEREQEATLLMGSDDTLAVWLNGTQVWNNKSWRGVEPDQDRVKVKLKAGPNPVLLKIGQAGGGWGFAFRVGDEFGLPLAGVSYPLL